MTNVFDLLPIGTVLAIKRPGEYSGFDNIIKCIGKWYYLKEFKMYRNYYIGTLSNIQVDLIKLSEVNHAFIGLEKRGVYKGGLMYSKLDIDAMPIGTLIWPTDDQSDKWKKNPDGTLSKMTPMVNQKDFQSFETKLFVDWFARGIFWKAPKEMEHMIR